MWIIFICWKWLKLSEMLPVVLKLFCLCFSFRTGRSHFSLFSQIIYFELQEKETGFIKFTKNMSLVFIYNIFNFISCKHLERTVELTVISDFELM